MTNSIPTWYVDLKKSGLEGEVIEPNLKRKIGFEPREPSNQPIQNNSTKVKPKLKLKTNRKRPRKGSGRKFERKIDKAKLRARSELKLKDWGRKGYYQVNFNLDPSLDQVKRVDYLTVDEQTFINQFEIPNQPCVIVNCISNWKANQTWNLKDLKYKYGSQKFKVGEDDGGNYVYLKLKHFIKYLNSKGQKLDDSPLYIFDSNFSTSNQFQHKRSNSKPKEKGSAKVELLADFQVPKYFQMDLFQLTGKSRPPFRWWVMGGLRSGTSIHLDPLGTSAWNGLVQGHKRWVLFPQTTPTNLIHPNLTAKDGEGVDWFQMVYPKFRFPAKVRSDLQVSQFNHPELDPSLGKLLHMVEVLQRPGEIIYVPGGWFHCVLNLDTTIAITQNFCTPNSIERVYLKTRFSRPNLAKKLVDHLTNLANSNTNLSEPFHLYPPQFYRELLVKIDRLKFVPALYTSSENSSGSSSSSNSDAEVSSTEGQ